MPAVLASAITIGLIALPFVVLGNIAGLEILHPAAVVILGGLVTSTILTLFVVPALYPRFVARAAAKTPTVGAGGRMNALASTGRAAPAPKRPLSPWRWWLTVGVATRGAAGAGRLPCSANRRDRRQRSSALDLA